MDDQNDHSSAHEHPLTVGVQICMLQTSIDSQVVSKRHG